MECVYLLQEIDFNGTPTGLYKIGRTTKEAEQRKRQYQAGNARRVDVYATIKVFNSQAVETELHRRFSAYRLSFGGGDEWFDFRHVNIAAVVKILKEYEWSIPQPPRQPTYSYSRESADMDLPPFPAALAVGLFVIIFAGFLGSIGVNSQLKEHYRQAYIPLKTYANNSGSGQYNTAAINFRRFAEASNDECLKNYGENMAEAVLQADQVLRETESHSQAWDTFRVLQQQAWVSANPCQENIKLLGEK